MPTAGEDNCLSRRAHHRHRRWQHGHVRQDFPHSGLCGLHYLKMVAVGQNNIEDTGAASPKFKVTGNVGDFKVKVCNKRTAYV